MQSTSSRPEWRVGRVIRRARTKKGWTLQDLARRASSDISQLSKIERGESGTTLGTYQRIVTALGMTMAILFARAGRTRRAMAKTSGGAV